MCISFTVNTLRRSRSKITVRGYQSSYPMIARIPSIAIRSSSMLFIYYLPADPEIFHSDLSPISTFRNYMYFLLRCNAKNLTSFYQRKRFSTKSKIRSNCMCARLHIKISLPCVKILCVCIKKILRKKEERERYIYIQRKFGQRINYINPKFTFYSIQTKQ